MSADEFALDLYPYRVEHWLDGAVARVLVAVSGPRDAFARLIAFDTDAGTFAHGEAALPPRAFGAPRERLVAAVPTGPAEASDAADYALPGPYVPDTVPGIARYLVTGILGIPVRARFADHARREPAPLGFSAAAPSLGDAFPGFAPRPPDELRVPPRPGRVRVAPAQPGDTPAVVNPPPPVRNDRLAGIAMIPHAASAVEDALTFLSALPVPDAMACLAKRHWSPAGYAFYAAAGTTGLRRRQAAALHPCLAPAFAHAPEIWAAIDAGRPFEALLAARLGTWLAQPPPRGVTVAAVRRMRTMPRDAAFDDICHFIHLAAWLEPDALPTDGGGWPALREAAAPLVEFAAATGLDLGILAKGGGARAGRDLTQASDMATWCAETLVGPFVPGLPYEACRRLAARLLFGGKRAAVVAGTARRWHEVIGPFQASLPLVGDDLAWPALFAPFESGGCVGTCLVTRAELREEGAAMSHCVAGYAQGCHAGEHHIVSVRDVHGRRLSTLELRVGPGFAVRSRQHVGRLNKAPPAEAATFADALMLAAADRTLPIDKEAARRRESSAFAEAVVRTDPVALDEIASAWHPYLPAGTPRDPTELASFLRGLASQEEEARP